MTNGSSAGQLAAASHTVPAIAPRVRAPRPTAWGVTVRSRSRNAAHSAAACARRAVAVASSVVITLFLSILRAAGRGDGAYPLVGQRARTRGPRDGIRESAPTAASAAPRPAGGSAPDGSTGADAATSSAKNGSASPGTAAPSNLRSSSSLR